MYLTLDASDLPVILRKTESAEEMEVAGARRGTAATALRFLGADRARRKARQGSRQTGSWTFSTAMRTPMTGSPWAANQPGSSVVA